MLFYLAMGHTKYLEGAIVYIVGSPGYGKTTLAVDIVSHFLHAKRRVLAYDVTGDISSYLESDGYKPKRVTSSKDLSSISETFSPSGLVVWDGSTRGIDHDKQLTDFLHYANMQGNRGDIVVADECELAFPIHVRNSDAYNMMLTSRNPRNARILIVATKRPQATNNILRGNTRFLCVFGIKSKLILENGLREFGVDYRLFEPCIEPEFPKFHYLFLDLHDPKMRTPVLVNAKETVCPILSAKHIL